MVCLVDPWPRATELQQKYQLADRASVVTDLTAADTFDIKELFNAKCHFKIIKIITSYENDLANLESIWQHEYTRAQWLFANCTRLSVADQVVFHQPVKLECLSTEPVIVFTPGRSGTHVLTDITGAAVFLHHSFLYNSKNILVEDQFLKIINAKKILSVLRRRFADQLISDAIGNRYGVMLTVPGNLSINQQRALTWEPFEILTTDYKHTLEKLCSYTDLLLGIKMFYNKQIEFSLLEDLREHFSTITHVKNPYRSQDIISNYSEVIDVCDQEYQPMYNQIINKLQCVFGTTIYHHD
jgi:hypothetical protein